MSRSAMPRHSRPSRRRSKAASVESLTAELAQMRTDRYTDHLEAIRLTALVDGLSGQTQRMAYELVDVRHELSESRAQGLARSPQFDEMTAVITQLRSTIARQESALQELSATIGDLLARLARQPEAAPADVPSRPVLRALPSDLPSMEPVAPAAESAPVESFAFAGVPADPVEFDTAALDDATLMRLRLIRQSFDR